MVELCTHLAIERARLVTSHLKLARLISNQDVALLNAAANDANRRSIFVRGSGCQRSSENVVF
jgi:hypothetical protein